MRMVDLKIKNMILNHLRAYNPSKVAVFGSFARGDNKPGSDLDILVEFKKSPSLLTLIKIENDLSELIGIKVDLITPGALKNKSVRKSVRKDLISIL